MTALPAPEKVLVSALKASSSVTAACAGRVATRVGTVFPNIRVTVLGGPDRPTINTGQPGFQIECWGAGADPADETAAANLAQAVEAAVEGRELVGVYPTGTVLGAVVLANVLHSPDPSTSRERYILSIELLTQ